MLRLAASQLVRAARPMVPLKQHVTVPTVLIGGNNVTVLRNFSSHHEETAEEYDQRFLDFFNHKDIDGWLVRKGMTELQHHDVIPEPKVCIAALRACRRVNDYALAVRFLECIRLKCGSSAKEIYPYIIQEIRPCLDELGISTPEEMGYDKPELFKPHTDWWPWDTADQYMSPGAKKRLAEAGGTAAHPHVAAH